MKIKAKNTEECATLFEIDVPKETIEKAFEEVYDEISKVAAIPGFRTGKAPRDLVKKHYVTNAKEEVLKRLIPEAYRKAVEEHKIRPVGLPEITDVNFEEGRTLSFKARVDTRPKFKIKNYKGIKVEKKKTVIKDEDVEKMLQSLREINAKYVAEDGRPVQLGDYVMSDMECFVDSKPAHKKRENVWLSVEKESFIPGLNEKMVGMKKDEERDIEVTLPEQYPDKAVAGKKAVYRIKVNGIKSRTLPALDDEFAKDIGKNNLDEVRREIRSELENRAKLDSEVDVENQLLRKLTDDNVFAVPSAMVKRQLHHMVEDSKRRLMEKGFRKEDLDKKEGEFAGKFKEDAVRQVRLMFILDEIALAEHIETAEADVENAFKSIAAQTGQDVVKVREYYEKEDLVDNLAEKIKEEKTIKFLLEKAEITEKE
ncbi:MAG: trigger factor [Candidatus Omnitrophota bacterium]